MLGLQLSTNISLEVSNLAGTYLFCNVSIVSQLNNNYPNTVLLFEMCNSVSPQPISVCVFVLRVTDAFAAILWKNAEQALSTFFIYSSVQPKGRKDRKFEQP